MSKCTVCGGSGLGPVLGSNVFSSFTPNPRCFYCGGTGLEPKKVKSDRALNIINSINIGDPCPFCGQLDCSRFLKIQELWFGTLCEESPTTVKAKITKHLETCESCQSLATEDEVLAHLRTVENP